MIPASRFMRKLNAMPPPKNVYTVSIYSSRDKTSPAKYCELPTNHHGKRVQNVMLNHLHHSDFVIKQSAYREISKHLNEGLKLASNAVVEDEPQSLQRAAEC